MPGPREPSPADRGSGKKSSPWPRFRIPYFWRAEEQEGGETGSDSKSLNRDGELGRSSKPWEAEGGKARESQGARGSNDSKGSDPQGTLETREARESDEIQRARALQRLRETQEGGRTPDSQSIHKSQEPQESHESHASHEGHDPNAFRALFWRSLLLTLPTLLYGELLPQLTGFRPPAFPGSSLIAPAFGLVVFVYGGRIFLAGALSELRQRLPGMMTLISLAIAVALVFSLAVTLGFPGMPLWEELSTLITVMLLGHWIEMRSLNRAQSALKKLAELLPDTALLLENGDKREVPVSELQEGDRVLVRPGAQVPADGEVEKGSSAVNESLLTGESRPVRKKVGSEVVAGSVNGLGALNVQITRIGEHTALAGIMRLVRDAQSSRSRSQDLADRAAFYLTFIALGAALLTAIAWLWAGASSAYTVERVVTVLVIACPHALGLAIPLVVAISTTLGAQNGLLLRRQRGLEKARQVDTVVFDKTGTLSKGRFGLSEMSSVAEVDADEALRLIASLEAPSEHAIAAGLVREAKERELALSPVEDFESLAGRGVRGRVAGRLLFAGGPQLLSELEVSIPEDLQEQMEDYDSRAMASIALIEDGKLLALFALADLIRPDAKDTIDALHQQGLQVTMLTGDSRYVADSVAESLGIDEVHAEVLPEQKVELIKQMQEKGQRVLMVGDGINDAPALLSAEVGVAIGAGTNVAVESGDVVLVRSDPADVLRILELSKRSYRKMLQNLAWAVGYNVLAIPLAAGVLAPVGIVLHPAVGALLMSASTVIVALNAQTLRLGKI